MDTLIYVEDNIHLARTIRTLESRVSVNHYYLCRLFYDILYLEEVGQCGQFSFRILGAYNNDWVSIGTWSVSQCAYLTSPIFNSSSKSTGFFFATRKYLCWRLSTRKVIYIYWFSTVQLDVKNNVKREAMWARTVSIQVFFFDFCTEISHVDHGFGILHLLQYTDSLSCT